MKKHLAVLSYFLAVLSAPAQEAATRAVVAILPFEASGVGIDETRTIENLVQSYVSELDEFRLIAAEDRDAVLSEWEFSAVAGMADAGADSIKIGALLSADYLLTGSVGALGDDRALTLQVIRTKNGEKRSVSVVHRSTSELALSARSLVRKIFDREGVRSAEAFVGSIAENDLIGSWQGDKGIELVKFMRGGKAVAVLSSGARMELSYAVKDDSVRVVQTSPNTDKFYAPVPLKVATALSRIARPMEWTFRLAAGKETLRGTKTATSVSWEADRILEVVHGSTREAEWNRIAR
ncbi:MAG: hypothetical protein A2413_20920 [Treponema sp. RIFOXYC1_FULL_61_9]|nr:MAG: hypothetical protein A2413_20920 [Treponema sp. RIFOXYC1_FULL_61_9]